MPQMVSIFNGLGGLSAVLLSFTEINKWLSNTQLYPQFVIVVLLVSLFIGSVAFTGSLLAFAKLDGYKWSEKLTLPFQHIINLILLVSIIILSFLFIDIRYPFILLLLSCVSVFEVFPMSRACLGKKIIFIYKWLKKTVSHLPWLNGSCSCANERRVCYQYYI